MGGPLTTDYKRRAHRRLVFEMARRPDLQGMRAVAVIAVFAEHLFGWPSGGFVGVDVFFVLSGFFITGLLLKERSHTGNLSFKDFYTRRVKRILPSALLVLVVTAVAAHYLFPATRAKETLVDALWAAVFAANVRFQTVGADYFQKTQPPSPLQHYWSLSIEEQFYFVWPALLLILFMATRRLYRRGRIWARQWGLVTAMTAVVGSSFAWAMYLSAADPNSAYFSTFTRVWELGVGALLAITGPWLMRIPARIRPALSYLGLAGVVASIFLVTPEVQFPAPWAALPVLSTATVVASFYGSPVRYVPALTNPVARWLGDTSYTLYLWHWPVIQLLSTVAPKSPGFYFGAIAISLSLTALTYHFYEDPLRKSNWLIEPRKISGRAWAAAGAFTAAAVILSIVGIKHSDQIAQAREEIASAAEWRAAAMPETANPCYGAPAIVTPGCKLRDPAIPLTPSIDTFAKDAAGEFECYRVDRSGPIRSCEYGYEGEGARRIALVGDSHAAAMLPAIMPILNSNKWKLTTYLGQSCRLVENSYCPDVQEDLIAHPYSLVITTGNTGSTSASPADFRSAWEKLSAAGNHVVAIADNPLSSEEAMACLTRVGGEVRTGECGTPRSEAFPQPDPLVATAQFVPAATLVDLTEFYCTADFCPSVIGNVIVYRDYAPGNSHITKTFAQTLAPALRDRLQQALTAPQSPTDVSDPPRR